MDDSKRYNVHGFAALSGLLEHVSVLQESDTMAVPPQSDRRADAGSSELQSLLHDIQSKLGRVVELLGGNQARKEQGMQETSHGAKKQERSIFEPAGGVPVDGVYDGQGNMVADDGTRYRIPPAYVQKAFLQEGDLMQCAPSIGGMKKFKKMRNY